jgi:hypothetical protein
MTVRRKLLGTALALTVLSTLAVAATFAIFTTQTTNNGDLFATGILSLTNSNGASATVTLTNMFPGDSVDGVITVSNNGTEDITSYQFSDSVQAASPTNPNQLTSDTADGLHIWIARCSQAWSGSTASYTCGGTQSDVVGTSASPVPILQNGASLASRAFCTSNATAASQRSARGVSCALTDHDYLKIRVSLPYSADNSFEGLSTTITFTFSGVQPSGTNF